MIKIAKIEAIRLQEWIDMDIDHNGIIYRFRVVVNESPKHKSVGDIEFRDKYEVPLNISLKKKIWKFIREYFKEEPK